MIPIVSVIMANFNGERHLVDALRSVLAQSLTELEVLFIDDASTDRSVAIARAVATTDSRLRVLTLPSNAGPGAARNHALGIARGAWVSIVDSDDYIHPERLKRLVRIAEDDGADIIADDMMIFGDDRREPPTRLLSGPLAAAPSWITSEHYVRANRMFSRDTPLGYLKPLIRTNVLAECGIRYDESLRIAEDYDLVLRLLTRCARFRLVPELLYFYRRHAQSISHRLSPVTLQAMIDADARFRIWAGHKAILALRPALDARVASIHVAAATEAAIASLKAHRPFDALGSLARQPGAVPIVARLAAPRRLLNKLRNRKERTPAADPRPTICVLSRQRLTTGSSGSSAYLLSLCATLRENGFALHLVCPSPAMLGRVPVLRIAGEGDVFDTVSIRGTRRIGGFVFARDPSVYLRAALGVTDRLARRAGITALSTLARPAPYAVGLPWTAEDFLFVAAETCGRADIVLADYGFLTPGIPYALRPGAASAVVMHDLFSSRPAAFAELGAVDGAAALGEAAEATLLAGAALVIAIQHDEAAAARRMLPAGRSVLVAPMAVETVPAAQAGEGGGLLFVGSSAAANVDGLRWFLAEIWPRILERRPDTRLMVAGSVCTAIAPAAGVMLNGRVPDLAPLYRRADVVISPLRVGSGLKVKLIEALANGKPVVATSVTAQGVAHLLDGAVALADTPDAFADEVLRLLGQPLLRAARAEAALGVARTSFSTSAAYGGVLDHLKAQYAATKETMPWAA
jgi:succinoglycan biosynthesis protein ExoO